MYKILQDPIRRSDKKSCTHKILCDHIRTYVWFFDLGRCEWFPNQTLFLLSFFSSHTSNRTLCCMFVYLTNAKWISKQFHSNFYIQLQCETTCFSIQHIPYQIFFIFAIVLTVISYDGVRDLCLLCIWKGTEKQIRKLQWCKRDSMSHTIPLAIKTFGYQGASWKF